MEWKDRTSERIGPHGGYRELKSYQTAEIVYDATVRFCARARPAEENRNWLPPCPRLGSCGPIKGRPGPVPGRVF